MILKICRVLPDMYIMIAFMGSCLAGARAISQDFFNLSLSVSSAEGALRGCCLEEAARYELVNSANEMPLQGESILYY